MIAGRVVSCMLFLVRSSLSRMLRRGVPGAWGGGSDLHRAVLLPVPGAANSPAMLSTARLPAAMLNGNVLPSLASERSRRERDETIL